MCLRERGSTKIWQLRVGLEDHQCILQFHQCHEERAHITLLTLWIESLGRRNINWLGQSLTILSNIWCSIKPRQIVNNLHQQLAQCIITVRNSRTHKILRNRSIDQSSNLTRTHLVILKWTMCEQVSLPIYVFIQIKLKNWRLSNNNIEVWNPRLSLILNHE